MDLNLFPAPKKLKALPGTFTLPKKNPLAAVDIVHDAAAPHHAEGYALSISKRGIRISYQDVSGVRAAFATLQQLRREYGDRLPCVEICDWPDFARRGVMLDISRGRVPTLETLLDLVEHLADFKINELQLYTEHTFAYRKHKSVWQSWGALTGAEIQKLDARCRELGIDLVPNQNSFGHLRYFLEDAKLKKLAEVSGPYEDASREFVRRPTTLAPNHAGTITFLRGLYDELLPNFSSKFFNVGCDETWDLGKGQSKKLCAAKGQGRVYVDFLKKINREVSARGKRMMFWGDIILKYPKLIRELSKDVVALNWGYEAGHPFDVEAARFAKSKIPFYVCPGTSTWQTLVGRHGNALANLRAAAKSGKKFGALGYLVCDWGDGGHPQPLAVSWPMLAAGASLAWNANTLDKRALTNVLSRDIFKDSTGRVAEAVMRLGFIHQMLGVKAANETPLGTVIAASPLTERELFCRNGLKWFAKIPAKKIRVTLAEIERQQKLLARSRPQTVAGKILAQELDLAARMAAQSCEFMLWQQVVAKGSVSAKAMAKRHVGELMAIQRDFNACWSSRNKSTAAHCSPFLEWRIRDYERGHVR